MPISAVMTPKPEQPMATVYYDGACPLCSREIAHYRQAKGAQRLAFVDAVNCDPAMLGPDLNRETALSAMHVRLADNTMVSGAAAFAALWRQLPGFAWAGRLASLPVLLPILELGYRVFVRLRRLWRR